MDSHFCPRYTHEEKVDFKSQTSGSYFVIDLEIKCPIYAVDAPLDAVNAACQSSACHGCGIQSVFSAAQASMGSLRASTYVATCITDLQELFLTLCPSCRFNDAKTTHQDDGDFIIGVLRCGIVEPVLQWSFTRCWMSVHTSLLTSTDSLLCMQKYVQNRSGLQGSTAQGVLRTE